MPAALTVRLLLSGFVLLPAWLHAEAIEQPAPLGKPANTAYRQILPDGRVIYSDRVIKGAKVDQVIDTDARGSIVVTEPPTRPATIPPRVEPTPVKRVPSATDPNRPKTLDEATADVIRAEMLLEDARRQQKTGEEPLPSERTGNADRRTSRLNEEYWARQERLTQRVKEAEEMVKKAQMERDAARKAW